MQNVFALSVYLYISSLLAVCMSSRCIDLFSLYTCIYLLFSLFPSLISTLFGFRV